MDGAFRGQQETGNTDDCRRPGKFHQNFRGGWIYPIRLDTHDGCIGERSWASAKKPFEKLTTEKLCLTLFHSAQGWQYQHAEYQRLLAEHNITQSMSRKGNCMDNGAMEHFFGRLKVEMFYGEQFESVDDFILALDNYIHYYNNERISLKLKGMSPVQYRTHALAS